MNFKSNILFNFTLGLKMITYKPLSIIEVPSLRSDNPIGALLFDDLLCIIFLYPSTKWEFGEIRCPGRVDMVED